MPHVFCRTNLKPGCWLHKACARIASASSLTFVFLVPLLALDPQKSLTQYAHRIWGQEEGLFQPTIYSILQGRDGFLWLGTQDSLIRFDGLHFREFADGNAAVFPHGLIRALAEDRLGNLWVGALGGGVARITPEGALTRFTLKDGLPSDIVVCLDAQGSNEVWACTNRGLARFREGRISAFDTSAGLPSNQVRATCQQPNGVRWVAGVDFGLAHFNGSRFQSYSDPLIPSKEGVTALVCANDGTLWAGTDEGVVHIARGRSRLISTQNGLPDNAVTSLLEGPNGSVWIGTNDGISRFRDGQISVYRTRDGLSHSLVYSLFLDREGSLWAGTKDGLDQFTEAKVTPFTTNEGLTSNDIGPVFQDASGRLWIGTLGRGLNFFDGSHFHSLTRRNGLADDRILSLTSGAGGDLWVGTANGLSRVRDGAVIATYTTRDGLSGAAVHSLLFDAQGTLWAGTERGLDRFAGNRFNKAALNRLANDAQASSADVVALAGSSITRLFISTDVPGFYALRNNAITSYSMDVVRPVDCYFLDPLHRTAWMGTLGSGLIRWRNGTIVHVHVKDGLYDNRIYSILKDDHENFWMASSKGIFRVSERELDDFADGKTHFITSIPFSTGQLRFECQSGVQPAAYRTHDGRLWFSTTNGLVMVDPNHLISNTVPPPVQITSTFVNGKRVDSQQEVKVMPWEEKNLEIRYAGLTFVAPEKVTFRYILEGYNKQWIDAGARREAFFTNLPPGEFQFKVLARNADGIWSKQAASLSLNIQPRLYQRTWFFPVAAAILGLLIAFGYRLRIRHLNNRFALVLAERNRIARELHDTLLQGLSGITMQLQAVWTRLPDSREKVFLGEIIKDAANCSQEARQSLWGLRAGRPGAPDFSEHLATVAKNAVEGKPIALALELEPISLRATPAIEFQLLRIAQEAISNTLTHSRATTLKIELRRQAQELCLTLRDNGVGFAGGSAQPFGHYGLTGMRERADEIGAELRVTSEPQLGTRVEVRLPLSRTGGLNGNAEVGLEHQYK